MAEEGTGLVRLRGPGRRCARILGGPVIDVGSPFIRLSIAVTWRADDDVGEPIAIDIPGGCDRCPEESECLIGTRAPGMASDTRRRAQEEIRPSLVELRSDLPEEALAN